MFAANIFTNLIVVSFIAIGVYNLRVKDHERRAIFVKKFAFGLFSVFVIFATLFIAGETMTDPGGVKGFLMVSAWLVPSAIASVVTWKQLRIAEPLVYIMIGLLVVASSSLIINNDGAMEFMDRNGPILTIISFAISTPIGLWAWHNPRKGGWALVISSFVPRIFAAVGAGDAGESVSITLSVVTAPMAVAGALFVYSAIQHEQLKK